MIDRLLTLEQSGKIYDVQFFWEVTENNVTQKKSAGFLSNYLMTVRSLIERLPQRRRSTVQVWGRDGDVAFDTPISYTRREYDITLNVYHDCGDIDEQVERVKSMLIEAEAAGATMWITNRNVKYRDLRIDINSVRPDSGLKGLYQSTLSLTISADPYAITQSGGLTI